MNLTSLHSDPSNDKSGRLDEFNKLVENKLSSSDHNFTEFNFPNGYDFTNKIFTNATFTGSHFGGENTTFASCQFSGSLTNFNNTNFSSSYTSFEKAQFRSSETKLEKLKCTGEKVRFDGIVVEGSSFSLANSTFDVGSLDFINGKYHCTHQIRFEGLGVRAKSVNWDYSSFRSDWLLFGGSLYKGDTFSMRQVSINVQTVKFGMEIETSSASIDGSHIQGNTTDFRGLKFRGNSLSFVRNLFTGGTIMFCMVDIGGKAIDFTGTQFNNDQLFFAGAKFHSIKTKFTNTRFQSNTFLSGKIYDKWGADLWAQIEMDDAVFDTLVFIDGADLSGFRDLTFTSFKNIGEEYGEGDKPNYDLASSAYRLLRNYFISNSRHNESHKAAKKEMDMIRKKYWAANNYWKYIWSGLTNLTCGYGENPGRTFITSWIVISIFGSIYYLAHDALNNTTHSISAPLWDSIYFSIVTFTTLGYGDFQPQGYLRIFASLEAILGVFFMALFVVTLSRKIMR